jgi:PAS domain S-box-containing protein
MMLPDTTRIHSRLDILYVVTREFGTRLDIDQVLQRVLSATVAAVGAYDASLILFDAAGQPEHFVIINGFEVQQRSPATMKTVGSQGLAGWVKKHREGALVKDASTDPRWYMDHDNHELLQVGSAVAVPIQLPEHLIGVITITATQTHHFDEDDLSTLRIIADQAAFAITNARLYKAEQRRHRFADTLTSVTQTLNSSLDLREVLNLILEQLALVVDYDSSSILLLEGDKLSVRAARGFEDMQDALQVVVPVQKERRANYQVVFEKKPVLINDVDAEPGWVKSSSSQNIHSWIGTPLVARDEVIGMLAVDSYQANKYTYENVMEVAAFADQAATAVANAQTVARLRSMEDSYTMLFEDSADMIIITDYQGKTLNANRKACQMLRRTKDALIGTNIYFIDRRLSDCLTENTKRLRAWRDVLLELELVNAYRETISLEVNARHVHYGNEPCVQWVGRDISARKESEKMRQDLINMLIHDLRGPVGNLINTIELLPMLISPAEDNARLRTLLELSKRSGQEVRDLLDSLLDVGRLEGGEIYLQRSMIDMNDIMRAVNDQVTPRAISKQMELMFAPLAKDVPEMWIDGSMIRRVLINLVDNAIKYTQHQGQIGLKISMDGETLCFAISDNGPGISKEFQSRIFSKFSRVDHSSNAPAGVGLGLAFCKLAIEAHGGTIWVESEGVPGKGSTFYFTIPILPPTEDA